MSTLLAIVAAFLLYTLLIPLFGVIIGFVARILLPYIAGVVLGYFLINRLFGWSGSQWLFILMAVSWLVAVWHSRFRLKRLRGGLAWYEGHYSGAFNTLRMVRGADRRKAKC